MHSLSRELSQSFDHIFTAFEFLGKKAELPEAVIKPLQNIQYNRHWLDSLGKGVFKVNWAGETAVTKMGTDAA
jgi:hypothetical protein